jgi:PAS domain S-box-containing protein
MSLERLSKLISIGFGMALVACLTTVALDEYFGKQAEQATDRRHQTITGVARMSTLNRELTQLARLYVGTGDELFLTQYNQKWQNGRTFHDAAMDFRAIGLTDSEDRLLAKVEDMDLKQTGMERAAMEESFHRGGVSLLATTSYINSEWNFAVALNQLRLSITERFNSDFEAARHNAELASHINVLMQLISLGAGLAFLVILRRQLVMPLLRLSERMRRLHAGEALGESPHRQGLAEVVTLADAFDAYVEVNEELRRQHWVKGHLGELVQALQLCASREAFAETLQQKLGEYLGCKAVLLFNAVPFTPRTGQVHFSLPLLQEGQQLASLELDFAHRPDPAQLTLLDNLPNRLGTLLSLLQQRTHNLQLLLQAHRQTRQLEIQALELQQRQQSLEATESWYRGIVEFAPKALLVFDEHGVILANQESEATFGYAPGSLLGQSYRTLVPDNQLEAIDHLLERVRINNVLDTVELVARRADGGEFPAEMRLCLLPAREDRGQCLCVAIRDLSQRKTEERSLREAHELQQAIVSSAPYGIALVQGGLITQANSRLDELLGYVPGEQLQCSPLIWLDQVMSAQTLMTLEAQVREALERGDIYQQQIQLRRKDAQCFWASVSARAIASGNQSRGSIWIIEDISAQQAAADEMLQARQLAEESARIKAEFLANMSHEIRTPMNAIIGMTHLTLKTELNERQRDYLHKVQRSSRHLLGVIDDILDFSKIEAGKLQLEVRDFSLVQLLEEALDQVRPRIAEKGLHMRLNIGADVPECLRGDSLRLRQILLNYLSNAVKFTERGQIRVEVSLRQAGADDALFYFSVTDSGIGLSSEQQKHMFQSFQQADASTTRRFGGTGLGLAIAKQLAGLMSGQVGVQSVLGEGSNFWFEVRLQLSRSTVIDGPTARETFSDWSAPEGTRVLLVEDNELNQQVAAELLQAVGCGVDIATDGRQALNRLSDVRYDLVFMDMQMPVLDGLAATRLLRQRPGLGTLPVIAMTANASQRDHDACLAAGMNDFVSKPFEPQTLYALLRRWLTKTPAQPQRAVTPQSGMSDADAGLKLDDVDTVAGLRRVLGRHNLYVDLLHRYLDHQSPLLDQLSAALAAGELVKAELLAHSCKGASATIGADAVAQAANALELALRAKRPIDELRIGLQTLSVPLKALLGQLQQKLPCAVEAAPTAVDVVELQRICQDLDALLGDFDAQAVPYFFAHASVLRGVFAYRFASLEGAIKQFDFGRAQACLREALRAVQPPANTG